MAVNDGSSTHTSLEGDTLVGSVGRAGRDLNRTILGLNGIQFVENEDLTWKPAPHIASLRDELLNFHDIVSPGSEKPQYAEKYPGIPDFGLLYPGTKQAYKRFKRALTLRKESGSLKPSEEHVWQGHISRTVFQTIGDHCKVERPTAFHTLKGAIAMNGPTTTWSEADKCRELPLQNFPEQLIPTQPEPDLYFAIQVYSNLPPPMGFMNRAFQNLTLEALRSNEGLICSPSKHLAKCKLINGDKKHMACFPFAIAEIKPDNVPNSTIEHCYCQAANAASCALTMLCKLCEQSLDDLYWHGEQHQVPPVVTFTFIGPKAKVWLAHVSNYQCAERKERFMHQYHMQCIWTGNLEDIWQASQLCSIVDQLGDWFLYIYRPWVCARLEQLKFREAQKKLKKSYKTSFKSDWTIERAFEDHWNRWLPEDDPNEGSAGEGDHDESGDYDDEVGSLCGLEDGDDDNSQPEQNESSESGSAEQQSDDDEKYERRVSSLGSRERSLYPLTPSPPTRGGSADDYPISGRTRSHTRARSADPSIRTSPPTPSKKGQQYLSPSSNSITTASEALRPAAHTSQTSPATLDLPLRHGRRPRSCHSTKDA